MGNLSENAIADFKEVVENAEALLKETANQGGDQLAAIRTKAERSLRVARARMDEVQDALLAKTREAAKATDVYVHENPWQTAGIAAGFGLAIGLLISRR